MSDKTYDLHMIGNAHIDPVWLWRFQDGLAEIKATFRSALDRIQEYDDFVFTCGCAMYYEWVEKNCPPLFEEIREAIKAGKWIVVGGMWIQPDCNMPSSESFARHMLYSQNYFQEKFGIRAETGYNVDSFGHSAGFPRLLQEGGLKNYTYLRPGEYPEMNYPFDGYAFRWQCGDSELLTYRIPGRYNYDITNENMLVGFENIASAYPYPLMFFYGVGNHGGGPTIANINYIHDYQAKTTRGIVLSNPNKYFRELRADYFDGLPVYTGELQNHGSGCYAANSKIKALNRAAENRLGEAERMEVLSAACAQQPINIVADAAAWKKVLFNQFHDILCGCATKAALEDAYVYEGAAIAHGMTLTNEAVQRISWAIDTHRELAVHSKEYKGAMWESNNCGTPIVVFNPLSYPVKVPVNVHLHSCTAVTDEDNNPIPYQMIRSDYTNHAIDTRLTSFLAEVPAYGWRTYWVYRNRTFEKAENGCMKIGLYHMENDKLKVDFNPITGEVASIKDAYGELLGEFGCRALVLDDSPNDTWAHAHFVFADEQGTFGNPIFRIVDKGECQVSLRVTQTYKTSTMERTYTLYQGDDALYVSTRLVLNEKTVIVKLTFDAGLPKGEFLREVPGDIITTYPAEIERNDEGRELPMLRWMAIREQNSGRGLAVINDSKYSVSCCHGELRMIAARSCYYGDHFGQRDGLEQVQDIGEQEFCYAIRRCGKNLTQVVHTADILNTEFPVIAETYHRGNLPQTASYATIDADNVTITCVKPAEDGRGTVIRLTEIAGRKTTCTVQFLDTIFTAQLKPFTIESYRLVDGQAIRCNFLEEAK